MSLLLLFNDQVRASVNPGMPAVRALLETSPGGFVDITSDLVKATIDCGRQAELDRFVAGTAVIELKNATRKYDPQNTAGPYYGNLKPMRQLLISETWAGVTYPLFAGYIDGFKQKYVQRRYSSVTIPATDAFKVLARAKLPVSAYAAEVEADSPIRWLRLDEPAGSATLYESISGKDMPVSGAPTLGAAGIVTNDPGSALEVTGNGQGGLLTGPGQAYTAFTVELVFKSNGTDDGNFFAETNDAGTEGFLLRADSDPDVVGFIVATSTGSTGLVQSSVTVDDGLPHHFALTWDGSNVRLYVDGVQNPASPTARGGTIAASPASLVYLGGYTFGPSSANGVFGSYQHLAVYDHALSAARILAHAQAVTAPWANDLPGPRAGRILDAIGFPAGLRDLDTGTTVLQAADLSQTPLEHLQKVAESELGAVLGTPEGKVRLAARTALVNQTSQGTFSDSPAVDGPIRFLEPDYSEDFIRNDVTFARSGGVAQNATDQDSIDEYQTQAYSLTGLFNADDDFSRDAAVFIVSEYAEPFSRITEMTLTPRRNPTVLYPQVLGRQLLDVVTVTHTPQGVGSPITQVSVIEHIRHEITPDNWETTWRLTPAYAGKFLQLDNPNTTIEGANAARLYV